MSEGGSLPRNYLKIISRNQNSHRFRFNTFLGFQLESNISTPLVLTALTLHASVTQVIGTCINFQAFDERPVETNLSF